MGMGQGADLGVQKGEISLQVAADEQQPSFSQRLDRGKGSVLPASWRPGIVQQAVQVFCEPADFLQQFSASRLLNGDGLLRGLFGR